MFCHFWKHGSFGKETYKGRQRKQMETRVSDGNTAATNCSLCVHLRLSNPAQAKAGEAGRLKSRGSVGALVSLSMGEHIKSFQASGFKTMFCGALKNPGEPCGRTSGRPQRKWARSWPPHLITTAPLCLLYTSGSPIGVQLRKRVQS